ncbi:hypothetical protein [Phyllobacterium zundukense]|jgi:hypothetical protein|uniref:hypothetical protein n=1 Tax=Phyllobacterium zundukense TaxID=1867719 RepID=UPI003965C9B8
MTTGWALFDKFLWRLWPLNRFVRTPDLNGTWLAEMHSSYEDPITKEKKGPIYGGMSLCLNDRRVNRLTESFRRVGRRPPNRQNATCRRSSSPVVAGINCIEIRSKKSHHSVLRYFATTPPSTRHNSATNRSYVVDVLENCPVDLTRDCHEQVLLADTHWLARNSTLPKRRLSRLTRADSYYGGAAHHRAHPRIKHEYISNLIV